MARQWVVGTGRARTVAGPMVTPGDSGAGECGSTAGQGSAPGPVPYPAPGPVAQRQSRGLLILVSWVRIPAGSPRSASPSLPTLRRCSQLASGVERRGDLVAGRHPACAPALRVDRLAPATASRAALRRSLPDASSAARMPLKTSPAPVASSDTTASAGRWASPASSTIRAPSPPSVTTTAAPERARSDARRVGWVVAAGQGRGLGAIGRQDRGPSRAGRRAGDAPAPG